MEAPKAPESRRTGLWSRTGIAEGPGELLTPSASILRARSGPAPDRDHDATGAKPGQAHKKHDIPR